MTSYQVISIVKSHSENSIEHITHIGYDCNSVHIVIPVADAILRIKSNPAEFFIRDGWYKAYVQIYKDQFIRTNSESTTYDDLLHLSTC